MNHPGVVARMFAAALILFCWGCYPKAVGPMGPEEKPLTWNEMSFDQRAAHMDQAVLPRVAVIFAEWRPERFADVDCTLCHRQGLGEGEIKMPTADLPRLSGDLLLGTEFSAHPETTQLKLDRLVPAVSEALGLKPFSIVTRRGFGCYSCHLGPSGPLYGN